MTAMLHALHQAPCEVRFDRMTRQLYATDASIYQIEPRAVAFPRNALEASAVIRAAAEEKISITPRGAGSGLVGGALGDGLIVEFALKNRQITSLDLDSRTVKVGTGVVLDQLNAFLKPHGYCFGPDVATSSRATIGGMIANNSSGARTPIYGTTADHVQGVEVVLADGSIHYFGSESDGFDRAANIERSIFAQAEEIKRRMPEGLLKRWPGYGLDRFLRSRCLADVLAGSEGTLAAITSADLRIVPLPQKKGLALIYFGSLPEAMQATVALRDLQPVAIEHIDRVLTDQTVGQLQFRPARDLMELDTVPFESILIVEFYEGAEEKLSLLEQRRLGIARKTLIKPSEMNLVWNLRKAGVALLTGCKGRSKPVTCIEDTAVWPERLPEYVTALQKLLRPLNVPACFYGHAASGLLHIRPVLDLHSKDDLKNFRLISDEVAQLVKEFKGSLAAEHGVGMARSEYMPDQLGPKLFGLMQEIKTEFDPRGLFNPGKILHNGRYRIDSDLRYEPQIELPFEPALAFAAKDESFLANLEQCNGCGGCRKGTPIMCPTFLATGEESMSTRGRANLIRAALTNRDGMDSEELEFALSNCLSCKACTKECPSNVNLALLKAELLHARHERHGLALGQRLLSNIDLLGKLGAAFPRPANAFMQSGFGRQLLSRFLGLSVHRPLPGYADERFDHWFNARQSGAQIKPMKGSVILWDDCFVRYHEPHIGKAAVKVLEAAGYEVRLLQNRQCCGRPAFSQGNLDEARNLGRHNVAALPPNSPVIFLEPSCYSMFAEDYRELGIPDKTPARYFLFEQFMEQAVVADPAAITFNKRSENIAIHAHCHARALTEVGYMNRLTSSMPGRTTTLLESGCCGMAGAFGALEAKYDLSLKIAEPLAQLIERQSVDTTIVASGTSCRHQIEHVTGRKPVHMAELLSVNLT